MKKGVKKGVNILKGGEFPMNFAPRESDIPRNFAPMGSEIVGGGGEIPGTPDISLMMIL